HDGGQHSEAPCAAQEGTEPVTVCCRDVGAGHVLGISIGRRQAVRRDGQGADSVHAGRAAKAGQADQHQPPPGAPGQAGTRQI
ncbi:hypothetical protein LPJ73_007697, partial [Coemansia sp. RSA 2703]